MSSNQKPVRAQADAAARLAENLGAAPVQVAATIETPTEQIVEPTSQEAVVQETVVQEPSQKVEEVKKSSKSSRFTKEAEKHAPKKEEAVVAEVEEAAEVETPIVAQKKAEVIAEVVTESKLSKEDQDYINSLSDDEEHSTESPLEVVAINDEYKEKYETVQSKVKEYEATLSHPLIEALSEFIKSGHEDITEFAKQVGGVDPTTLTIEDLYRMQGVDEGFEGEELEDAIAEEMDSFNSLTPMQKRAKEKELRSLYKSSTDERLKNFSASIKEKNAAEQSKYMEMETAANTELNEITEKMKGQKWKSILVDETMISQIKQVVPTLAVALGKFDDNKNFVGFDIKEGIDMAMWKLYGKQLLKSTFDIGRTSGFDEAMKERTRTVVTPTGNSPAVLTSSADNFEQARKEAAKKANGNKSLFTKKN